MTSKIIHNFKTNLNSIVIGYFPRKCFYSGLRDVLWDCEWQIMDKAYDAWGNLSWINNCGLNFMKTELWDEALDKEVKLINSRQKKSNWISI